ncbi:YHYH protein [Flavobacterium sp.]|jgi:hypothetical protein|uniref:YHYH protein n=1 Tax=Flavobacterium sp. TaxID=239 RepID=UPI0037BECB5D
MTRPSLRCPVRIPALLTLALLAACNGGGGGGNLPPAPPGAPSIGGATAGDGSIAVSFSPPASVGSSPIVNHVATCTAPGSTRSQSGVTSPITMSGLTNGVTYTCSVVATNSFGAGPASATVTATPRGVPGAPTIGTAIPGNTSATVSFTPPSANGGSPITGYTVSCAGGGTTRTASGTSSPLTVTGLVNGTSYLCSAQANSAVGAGPASGQVSVTPRAGGQATSTDGVLCTFLVSETNPQLGLNASAIWSCNPTRAVVRNGIPNHPIGNFPNADNPYSIVAQNSVATLSLAPAIAGDGSFVGGASTSGFALNGVKFAFGTRGRCEVAAATVNCNPNGGIGAWAMEAIGSTAFRFGVDDSNGNVDPGTTPGTTGEYRYLGLPNGLIAKLGGGTGIRLVGWAIDGFPIYARYGHSVATDASSAIKELVPGYRLKAAADLGRPPVAQYPLGSFEQDYEFVPGLGDLDRCNGRTGVTPEFPNGIYHYVITAAFPQGPRCIRGTASP